MYIKDVNGNMVNSVHIIRIKTAEFPELNGEKPFMITADLTVGTAVLGQYNNAAARDHDYKELEDAINQTEAIISF